MIRFFMFFFAGLAVIVLYQNCGKGFEIVASQETLEGTGDPKSADHSPAQVFLGQPTTKSVYAGDLLFLQPIVQLQPGATFQWFKNETEIAGATDSFLTIQSSSTNDSGTYVLQMKSNQRILSSPPIQVSVVPAAGPSAPTGEVRAAVMSVNEGQDLVVQSNVTGSPTPTYSWRVEGANTDQILGSTSDTFIIKGVRRSHPGLSLPMNFKIFLTVRNAEGTKEISADFSLLPAVPKFTQVLADQTVLVGDVVRLCARASGTYQWSKDGSPITNRTSCLLIFPASRADSGIYKVTATNSGGSASSEARLTVGDTPVLRPLLDRKTSSSVPEFQSWCVSTSSHESIQEPNGSFITSLALPTLKYQWYKEGAKLTTQTKSCLTGASGRFEATDSGSYKVEVSNETGTASVTANLLVVPKNQILLVKGLSDQQILWQEWQNRLGQEAFCVEAVGVSSYVWYQGETVLPYDYGPCLKLVGTSKSLSTQSGRYKVKMIQGPKESPSAVLESSATFDFSKAIEPISPGSLFMVDDFRVEGMAVDKSIGGATSEQLSGAQITWYHSGQVAKYNQGIIPYRIPKAELSDSGRYEVRITTALGQTVMASANLTVVPANAPPYLVGFGLTKLRYFPDGGSLKNCLQAVGSGPLSYSWKKNGETISGQSTNCFYFPETYDPSLKGTYEVTVTNTFGSNTSGFVVP